MLDLTLRPHRRAVLANRPDSQKLFVLVRLAVGSPDGPGGPDPTPVDAGPGAMALAVDTSGSMFAKLPDGTSKIDRAIDSIASIGQLPELQEGHRLAIVQFDTDASSLLSLQPMGKDAPRRLDQEAQRLRRFGGGTNLARALRLVLAELEQAPPGVVRKAVVLTDGETTDEPECLELTADFAARGIGLICVGLGADYNEDFLAELADRTNGFLYHLSETAASMARLETALRDTLSRSHRELVTDVRIRLDPGPEVAIRALTRVYPMVQPVPRQDENLWRVGNLDAASQSVLVAELDVPPRPEGTLSALLVSAEYDESGAGIAGASVRDGVNVTYTADAARAAQLDDEVVFYVQQARLNAMADQAVQQARAGRTGDAQKSLVAVRDLSDRIGNVAMSRAAERAVDELASSNTLLPDTAKTFKVSAKTLTILSPPTMQQPGGRTKH